MLRLVANDTFCLIALLLRLPLIKANTIQSLPRHTAITCRIPFNSVRAIDGTAMDTIWGLKRLVRIHGLWTVGSCE